jgi:hypothetical protein
MEIGISSAKNGALIKIIRGEKEELMVASSRHAFQAIFNELLPEIFGDKSTFGMKPKPVKKKIKKNASDTLDGTHNKS